MSATYVGSVSGNVHHRPSLEGECHLMAATLNVPPLVMSPAQSMSPTQSDQGSPRPMGKIARLLRSTITTYKDLPQLSEANVRSGVKQVFVRDPRGVRDSFISEAGSDESWTSASSISENGGLSSSGAFKFNTVPRSACWQTAQ